MTKELKRSKLPSKSEVEIPKHLPAVVRSVAESLLMYDPVSGRRYLEMHLGSRDK
jgi:hypothetical protein